MKNIIFGYILAMLTIIACAGREYKYYGLNLDSNCYDQGVLLGKIDSYPDIPFSVCKPDDVKKGKCIIMTSDEFFAAKQETLELRQALKDCQKGTP